MQFRGPSANGIRRRSAGSIVYEHDTPISSVNSRSQPNISGLENSCVSSPISPLDAVNGEVAGYHIYCSVATLDVGGEDTLEPATLSSSANAEFLSDSFVESYTPLSSDDASVSFNRDDSGIHSGDTDSRENIKLAPGTSLTATGSIDSGHRGLISSIGTTAKFTHKWPRPNILKYLDAQSKPGCKSDDVDIASLTRGVAPNSSLEEGQGLRMGHISSWTASKWCLLISIMSVFAYGCAGLIMAIMTWFNAWQGADIMFVADNDVLILITLAGSILLFTAVIGLTGTLLNSRPVLAIYGLLLWPAMLSLLVIGYTSYRRYSLSLDHKLNLSWSRYYTPVGRRIIQDSLNCCGFYSAMHEATPSKKCYLRAALPGCKAKLFDFERNNLKIIWKAVFSLFPLHLVNVVVALLCANHITTTFGKGITPLQYRLVPKDVKADADKILTSTGVDLSGIGFNVAPVHLSEKS